MRVIQYRAENVKRLKIVEFSPDANVVRIQGRNEQGKTTVLQAIEWALRGKGAIQEKPIRRGQKKATSYLVLGDVDPATGKPVPKFKVTRSFTETDSYLEVASPEGAVYKSPQALLDKLLGEISFNPLEFARADAKKQVEILLRVTELAFDQADFVEKFGQPATPDNVLDVMKDIWGRVSNERTMVNRDVDRTAKVLNSMPPLCFVPEAVSLQDLVAEKDALASIQKKNDGVRKGYEEQTRYCLSLENEVESIGKLVEDLSLRLERAQKDLAKYQETYAAAVVERNSIEAMLEGLRDPDFSEITARIAKADEQNKAAAYEADRKKVKAEHQGYAEHSDKLTSKLEALKDFKRQLIAGAKYPIPGLGFEAGGVTFNGLPFDQASKAEKWMVSLAIGMALNPELRVIVVEDASLLDSEHLAIVEQMAKDRDFQIWLELVDTTKGVGIRIEDGQVMGDDDNQG